jgi:hypothetical protein
MHVDRRPIGVDDHPAVRMRARFLTIPDGNPAMKREILGVDAIHATLAGATIQTNIKRQIEQDCHVRLEVTDGKCL